MKTPQLLLEDKDKNGVGSVINLSWWHLFRNKTLSIFLFWDTGRLRDTRYFCGCPLVNSTRVGITILRSLEIKETVCMKRPNIWNLAAFRTLKLLFGPTSRFFTQKDCFSAGYFRVYPDSRICPNLPYYTLIWTPPLNRPTVFLFHENLSRIIKDRQF